MPCTKPIDRKTRDLAQALILQGVAPTNVARELGVNPQTVLTWNSRYGWRTVVSETRHKLQGRLDQSLSKDIASESNRTRTALAKTVSEASETLGKVDKSKPNLKRLQAVADVTNGLVAAADKLFGWSESQSETLVSVQVLRELAESGVEPAGQVLDVQAEPSAEEPAEGIMSHNDS